ncbi:MAG TPA: thymidine phosphorylase, partial [Anaerolineales bacterium]
QLKRIGIVLTGQSVDLAPADGKLYALRDVTGTVQSIPLIASSIMSKKIAAGAQAILLDVKVGLGAFMTDLGDARKLARLMVAIGKLAGRRTVAILSDMNQPLGEAVGNSLELQEALNTLRGGGPEDFRKHCLVTCGYMLWLGGLARSERQGRKLAQAALASGKALNRFREFVQAQGGDVKYVDKPELLEKSKLIVDVPSPRSGYLAEINAREVGETAVMLGGGRAQKGDPIDYTVGVIVKHKVGDKVKVGELLFTIHANDEDKLTLAKQKILDAHRWSDEPVKPLPLYYGTVD